MSVPECPIWDLLPNSKCLHEFNFDFAREAIHYAAIYRDDCVSDPSGAMIKEPEKMFEKLVIRYHESKAMKAWIRNQPFGHCSKCESLARLRYPELKSFDDLPLDAQVIRAKCVHGKADQKKLNDIQDIYFHACGTPSNAPDIGCMARRGDKPRCACGCGILTLREYRSKNPALAVRMLQRLMWRRFEDLVHISTRSCSCSWVSRDEQWNIEKSIKSRQKKKTIKWKPRYQRNFGKTLARPKIKKCNHVWKKRVSETTITGVRSATGTIVKGGRKWDEKKQKYINTYAVCEVCKKTEFKGLSTITEEANPLDKLTRGVGIVGKGIRLSFSSAPKIETPAKNRIENPTIEELNTLRDPKSMPAYVFKNGDQKEEEENIKRWIKWKKNNRLVRRLDRVEVRNYLSNPSLLPPLHKLESKRVLVDHARAHLLMQMHMNKYKSDISAI